MPALALGLDQQPASFQGVFQAEDIFVAVGAQRGMESGTNKTLLFGALEEAAVRFHAIIAEQMHD